MIKDFENYEHVQNIGSGSQWKAGYKQDDVWIYAYAFVPGERPTRADVRRAFEELETNKKGDKTWNTTQQ